MPDPIPLQPGQSFARGRFVLVRILGRGGMGEVWLAQDKRLNELVALKFFPSEIRADAAALDDLRRETARSHQLSHPHIVRIHDLHEEPDGTSFIAMAYVDGPTLAALRLQQAAGVLSWDYLRPLFAQLCAALDYAHGEKIIHRDLKPANLMVDSKGRLKLADFGIAAVASDSLSRISVKHSTSGTLPYMNPQQAMGKRPQATDDLYALGAVLYELLTGKPPFHTGDITHQVLREAPEPMEDRLAAAKIQNTIPPEAAALVMACLAKDSAQRPQSARLALEWIGLELETKPSTESLAAAFFPQSPEPKTPVPIAMSETPVVVPPRNHGKLVTVGVVVLVMIVAFWLRLGSHLRHDAAEPAAGLMTNQINEASETPPPAVKEETTPAPSAPREELPKQMVKISPPSANTVSRAARPWTNSLGMRFVPVPGTKVLFSIWDTRVQDFTAFVKETGYDATERDAKELAANANPTVVHGPGYDVTGGMFSLTREGWAQRGDSWQSPGFIQGPTHPVLGLSWNDAKAFCAWLTEKERKAGKMTPERYYRLPTDAEWSIAVGLNEKTEGTPREKNNMTNGVYPWGTAWPPPPGAGNYAGEETRAVVPATLPIIKGYRDGYANTSPVGSFPANRFGLYDMGGNVWQWCEDWFDQNHQARVLRGAAWFASKPAMLESVRRRSSNPNLRRNIDGGFRCVVAMDGNAR